MVQLPAVHDPRARRRADRGPRVPRRRAGQAERRGARGDRFGARGPDPPPPPPPPPPAPPRPPPPPRGPSTPLASIGPSLAVPGIREATLAAAAPVVAVSPIVDGEVLKGPTAAFMAFAALDVSADGVADFYGELLEGIVADENVARLTTLQTDTRMDDAPSRARLAAETLAFAESRRG